MVALLWLACSSKLPVVTLEVDGHAVSAEVASTFETRARGLMHRDGLATDSGMLFIYPDSAVRGFWMKNTRIPLSIAYADSTGEIVHIADMKPHDLRRVSSLAPAMYALEMDKGWFEAKGVEPGDHITDIPKDLVVE